LPLGGMGVPAEPCILPDAGSSQELEQDTEVGAQCSII
jgi:hypothetical protein